ncbi:MAG: hypothetical protein ABI618_10015 [Nitrospirota bacterium]
MEGVYIYIAVVYGIFALMGFFHGSMQSHDAGERGFKVFLEGFYGIVGLFYYIIGIPVLIYFVGGILSLILFGVWPEFRW